MTPQLRFPEFTDEWQMKKLGDLLEIRSASRVHKDEWTESGVPFFRSSDVVAFFKGEENTKAFISQDLFKKLSSKSGSIGRGDILVTGGGSIGIPYLVSTNDPLYFKDADLLWIKQSDSFIPSFLYNFFVSPKFKRYLSSISHIGTIGHYTIEQAKDTPIAFPAIAEQQKIAEFLTTVDDKISALEQKADKLETYKRGMMQKIFSQQIRFTRDDGSQYKTWELYKAGDLFSNISNRNHNGDLPVLSVTQDEGVVARDRLDRKINQSNEGVANYKIIEPDDFVISLRSFQGGIEMSNILGISSPAYTVLRGDNRVLPELFKHYFKRDEFISKLSSTVIGIRDGKQISYGPFSTIILPVPTLEEQQKIAEFLSALDEKITLSRDKLEKTKEFKKGLLQRMFV